MDPDKGQDTPTSDGGALVKAKVGAGTTALSVVNNAKTVLLARKAQALDRVRNYLLPPSSELATPISRDDHSLVSNQIDALLQRPPPPAWMVIRLTFVICIVALLWAACTRVDEITVGDGRVVPASYVQVIQNLEGGIVAEIPVQVGSIVHKDQIVMRLDETRFASSVDESKAKGYALQAQIARLQAEADGVPLVIPESLLKEAPQIAKDELNLYASRQRELDAGLGILRQQLDQRGQEIAEKSSRLKQLGDAFDLMSKELQLTQRMQSQGVVSEVELIRIQRQYGDTRGELEATRLAIPRLEAQRNEARTKLDGAIAKFRADAAHELGKVKAELAGTTAGSVALEDRLARTTVRAPLAGIVKSIKVNTVGGVLQPGMEVMEIVPIEDRLLVEAKVRPADIGFLRPGQSAMVKISAYDFSIYGGLDGQVETISADAVTNEKGEAYYLVRIRTPKNSLGTPEKPLPIIPGMLATVHIRTGEKSVLSYLTKPLVKAKTEALRER